MGKKIKLIKSTLCSRILSILFLLVLSFVFVACDDSPGVDGDDTLSTDEMYLGVVAVYDVQGDSAVFYDKYTNENKSFEWLVDRQFDSLSTYLYNNLIAIYGNGGSSNSFANFGEVVTYNMANILDDSVQSDVAQLTSGTTVNKTQLNYVNTINGGYDLVVNADGTWNYGTTLLSDNAWKCASVFNKNNLKSVLAYIYENVQPVEDEDGSLSLVSDIELKDYYVNFDITENGIINYEYEDKFEVIGFSRAYMWNVLYMISYSIIGEDNIAKTLNNYDKVFLNNEIRTINSSYCDSTVESAFESYKGYDIVLNDLVKKAFNCSIVSGEIQYKDYFSKENWDTTLYPCIEKSEYVFYDNINLVLYDENSNTTPKKLKSLIYIPNITDSGFINDTFTIEFLFVGLVSEETDNMFVDIKISGVFDSGSELKNSSIVFDEEYDDVENGKVKVFKDVKDEPMVDGYINYDENLSYTLGSAVPNASVELETMMNNSFTISDYNVQGEVYKKGVLNVFNQFVIVDAEGNPSYNFEKNFYYYNFDYYDGENNLLSSVPEVHVVNFMSF